MTDSPNGVPRSRGDRYETPNHRYSGDTPAQQVVNDSMRRPWNPDASGGFAFGSTDRTATDRTGADRAATDRAGADRSAVDRSAVDRSVVDRGGAVDRGTGERPAVERTVGESPVSGRGAGAGTATHAVDRVRGIDAKADRGTTTVANEVVEKITGIAVRRIAGVYELGGEVSRRFAAGKERAGAGAGDAGDGDRGVSVRIEGRRAAIRVVLVVEFGYPVYTVAEQVRTEVIGAVETMLGLEVTAVDVFVIDVHVDEGREGQPRVR